MRNNKNHVLDLISIIQDKGINPETNELYLHSHFDATDDEHGIDYRCATTFIKNFHYLTSINDKPIIIHMDSLGGEVSRGLSIYDIIKQEKRGICIIGYSEVASMASTLLQAPKLRILLPSSTVMIHSATVAGNQHINAAKSSLKLIGQQEDFMLNVYAEKCVEGPFFKEKGYTLSKIKKYLRRKMSDNVDWYLDASESLDYGLCDGILGSKQYPDIAYIRSIL